MFVFTDAVYTNKTFVLPPVLDFSLSMGGIVNKLSGCRRSDYSEIKKVIMAFCDIFPAMFRFVICDGIGGYNDDAGSVCYTGEKSDDGSRTRGWRGHRGLVCTWLRS